MTEEKQNISNLLHPLWIFFTLSIPHSLIIMIFIRIYTMSSGFLNQDDKESWHFILTVLAVLFIAYTLYGLYCLFRKKQVHVVMAISIVCIYTLLFAYYYGSHTLLYPLGRIPTWLVNPDNARLLPATFLLPCLIYALFVLTRQIKPHILEKSWQNFAIALGIPILWFFLLFLLMSAFLFEHFPRELVYVLFFLIAIGLLPFLFFLIRGLDIIVTYRSDYFVEHRKSLLVIFCAVVPVVALLINNGHILGREGEWIPYELFGDFGHPIFYWAALFNGLILCFPQGRLLKGEEKHIRILRLVLFLIRSIMFCVTIYFFISLLPFFPFAFPLILLLGLGFLILSPLVLFVFHLLILLEDFRFLAGYFKKRVIFACLAASFFIIPLIVTFLFLAEKHNLQKALEYAFETSYIPGGKVSINPKRLKRTIETIFRQKYEKDRGVPYIDGYYKLLVLNNLTLSDEKMYYIESMFTSTAGKELANRLNKETERLAKNMYKSEFLMKDISWETSYNKRQKLYRSTVHLVLEELEGKYISEYKTYFKIPPASWIDDYYVFIRDEKVKGLIDEKKSALWGNRKTSSSYRSAGTIEYTSEDRVMLTVFPFEANETREAVFSITHLEPITLTIDGREIELGREEQELSEPFLFAGGDGVYLSRAAKSKRTPVKRTPYAHFIVDCSAAAGQDNRNDYIRQINSFLSVYPGLAEGAKITFANYHFQTLDSFTDKKWQKKMLQFKQEGSLALDKVLKSLLYAHYNKGEDRVPVFIVVTNSISQALFDDSMEPFAFTFPDSPYYYHLSKGKIFRHSFLDSSLSTEDFDDFFQEPVISFTLNNRTYYVPEGPGSSIITAIDTSPEDLTGTLLEGAGIYLKLSSLRKMLTLYPEKNDALFKMLFKESLDLNILTPLTSFSVLENEVSREALRRKQQQILSSKKYLDAGE